VTARSLLVVVALVGGCKGDTPNAERKLPNLHPTPTVGIPSDLQIPVEIDGQRALDIDAKLLSGRAPDFADGDRSAWRLDTLIPGTSRQGTEFVAEASNGVSVAFRARPTLVPVLLLNRRGEIQVQAMDPKTPFPRYHGEGERLGRPPREVAHVADLARISVTRPE
jgi:hypothetical protein